MPGCHGNLAAGTRPVINFSSSINLQFNGGVKNHYERTYFEEFMPTCFRGAVFLRHIVDLHKLLWMLCLVTGTGADSQLRLGWWSITDNDITCWCRSSTTHVTWTHWYTLENDTGTDFWPHYTVCLSPHPHPVPALFYLPHSYSI